MSWGTIEVEAEIKKWLVALPPRSFRHVAWYIDLLAEHGAELGEPYSRQLSGKLRELRFSLGGRPTRISYFIRAERRIVLLTVFRKRRRRERMEIARAMRAMIRCQAEAHGAPEEEA